MIEPSGRLLNDLSERSARIALPARPYFTQAAAAALTETLASGWIGTGPRTKEFESAVARLLGVPEVVAVASGTAALHIALMLVGVGPGDEVIVPSLTFCATTQAITAAGAVPVFCEVDPSTLCVTPELIRPLLTRRTRAVLPVLYGGRAVDLSDIAPTLEREGVAVVEDAAHALGSMQGEVAVGATGHAVTCFSFDAIKAVTCGEGGVIVPRNPEQAARARRIRNLGIDQADYEKYRSKGMPYDVTECGYRYHMPDLNAALGLTQLDIFPEIRKRRRDVWRAYRDLLAEVDGVKLVDCDVDRTVPYNCVVRVRDGRRDDVMSAMKRRGIGVTFHYAPNHLHSYYHPWRRPLPVTEMLGREVMSLPFHTAMDGDDAAAVVSCLEEELKAL